MTYDFGSLKFEVSFRAPVILHTIAKKPKI